MSNCCCGPPLRRISLNFTYKYTYPSWNIMMIEEGRSYNRNRVLWSWLFGRMDFMNGVFGASGCNPDGTVGQNAFTSMADRMMESHFFDVQQSMAGMDPNVVFVDNDSFQHGPSPQAMHAPMMMMPSPAQQAPWGMSAGGPMMMMPPPHMMMMPPPHQRFPHPAMHQYHQEQQHQYYEEEQEYYEVSITL